MSTKRNLQKSKIYLAGQIEFDPQNANEWRATLARDLSNIEPEIIIWNPLIKPLWMSADARSDSIAFDKATMFHGYFNNNEVAYDPTRGWNAAHEIRRTCKKLASSCDFMIARITKTFTWGSIDELEIAAAHNKPVFLWLPDGPISTYGIPGCVPNYNLLDLYVFYDYAKLLAAVSAINDGTSRLLLDDPFAWTYITYTNAALDNKFGRQEIQ